MKESTPLVWRKKETPAPLTRALTTLGEEFPLRRKGQGLPLRFQKVGQKNAYRVRRDGAGVVVEHGSTAAALRGVGAALARLETKGKTPLETLGIMLDCSRGAVMTIDHLKKWARRLALLGYNMIMLYTEDTYQLPGEPYFGYMRGGYSIDEIKEFDAHCRSLGIELIACFQTLGHLEQILKWDAFKDVADTEFVLLADANETYQLIDKMMAFWSEALSSRRVHVGMDEAHSLGRGKFIDKFGYERQFEIFNRHLAKVRDIAAKHGLQTMIWSDMYFRMGSETHDYYDRGAMVPDEVKAKIPDDVELVYWDYYHEDEDFYTEWIRRHRELAGEPLVASGIWTWGRFWYDHEQTVKSAKPCVRACRSAGAKQLFFTMWGDGGAYCEFDSALAGMTWAADLAYGGEGADDAVESVFAAICGGDYLAQLIPGGLHVHLDGDKPEVKASTMMWDDPLLGIGWRECQHMEPDCWNLVLDRLREIRVHLTPHVEDVNPGDLGHAWNVCDLFIKKLEFRTSLIDAYQRRDREALGELERDGVPAILTAVENVKTSFRRQWLRRNKPFGLEVIQIRLAAQTDRFRETALRIRELLDGNIDAIPELDVNVETLGQTVGFFDWLATGALRV